MDLIICIHGILGGKTGKDGHGGLWSPKELYSHLQKQVIVPNKNLFKKIKIVIHSWSLQEKEEILSVYKPVKHLIEAPTLFHEEPDINRKLSKFTSLFKSFQLCENLGKDDIILHIRFDLSYKKPLIIDIRHINKKLWPTCMFFPCVFFPEDPSKWRRKDSLTRVCDNFFFGNGRLLFNHFNNKRYDHIIKLMQKRDGKCLLHGHGRLDNHTTLKTLCQGLRIIKVNNYRSALDVNAYRLLKPKK